MTSLRGTLARLLTASTLSLSALASIALAQTSDSFVDHVTGAESGGSYSIYNQGGGTRALGRYQFIPSTFADQGYMRHTGGPRSQWTSYTFTPEARAAGVNSVSDLRFTENGARLQDAAFNRFTAANERGFSGATRGAVGRTVGGVTMTRESMLSAAHFLGVGGLNTFVASGFDATSLPWEFVTANGWSSYAELQSYLMNRMADASGTSYDGSYMGSGFGGGGMEVGGDMYSGTEGFPGFGSKRPVMITEQRPFQGEQLTLGPEG